MERDEILQTLVALHDRIVRRAELVATPDIAYEPLPPGLADRPTGVLTMLQHHTRLVIGYYLLGLPGVQLAAVGAEPEPAAVEAAVPASVSAAVAEFRATVDDMMRAVSDVDLNALLAHPLPGSEDLARAPSARWLLMKLIADTGEALGEINALFDLAQGGHLTD